MFPDAVTVRVVIIGTVGVALIFRTPVALLVNAVTVPVPPMLKVKLLVSVADVIVPVPEFVTIPLLVRVATEHWGFVDPVRFSAPIALLVKVPEPASTVPTVSVPLLVSVMAVTVTLGMDIVPVRAWPLVSKVCIPVLAVNVPLFVMPPRKVGIAAAVSDHVPPAATVTRPVKVLAPVALLSVNVPLVPPPTVVVPVTAKVKAGTVKFVPSPILRFPLMAMLAAVVAEAVPLRVRFPPMVVMAELKVFVPLPDKVRL